MAIDRQRSFNLMVGERIKAARKEKGMNQVELSAKLGIKDRQTLSYIEAGTRKVTSEEMMGLMRVLEKSLEYFTDPFRLVGEGAFCWRAEAAPAVLDSFEDKAKSWIATFRSLGESLGEPVSPLIPQLKLNLRSSFEDAKVLASQLNDEWELGEIPSRRLPEVAEERLKVLVLYVDPPPAISGAACHLQEFNTILINRTDPDGRRNFDFAHELFHLLTWQTMPPERLEVARPTGSITKRREQLANNFASALLLPQAGVQEAWEGRGRKEINGWINKTAEHFGVTSDAFQWRLRNLGLLSYKELAAISPAQLTWFGRPPSKRELPKLFSLTFAERLHKGLEKGFISVRRAASLLDMTVEDLYDLLTSYGFKPYFEY